MYELVVVTVPDLSETEREGLIDSIRKAAEKSDGSIMQTDVWGKRQLAYPIKRYHEGVYVLLTLTGGAKLSKSIVAHLKQEERVIRHLIVQKEEEKARKRSRA